jgi:hypothetical protein
MYGEQGHHRKLQNVAVDYCLPLSEIAPLLAQLASTRAGRLFCDP